MFDNTSKPIAILITDAKDESLFGNLALICSVIYNYWHKLSQAFCLILSAS